MSFVIQRKLKLDIGIYINVTVILQNIGRKSICLKSLTDNLFRNLAS